MTRKYYFDETIDYGDDIMTENSKGKTIRYNDKAWKEGHKQPRNRKMYWV